MKKRSMVIILSIFFMVGLGTYFFTPLGPKVRAKFVRLRSQGAAALKVDRQVSERAYQWQLTDTDGRPYNFAAEKGKVVFLNFWATWCAPCLKEMPDIQKLYDRYGENVSFLLVTKEDPIKVRLFLKKNDYTVPIYLTEEAEIPEAFHSKTIPISYIIDSSGKIRMAKSGVIDVKTDAINEVFDTLVLKVSS